MRDSQPHRGRHQADGQLFDEDALARLREALVELCWLLSRGYTETAALKLVGDRHALEKRQRMALLRSACTDQQKQERSPTRRQSLAGEAIAIDGFNAIITFEVMLSGGPIFVGRDGVRRDIASVHGSYRSVEETEAAIELISSLARPAQAVLWLLDRPVSHSGRLAQRLRDRADAEELPWKVELVNNPDRELVALSDHIIASSDSWVLDRAQRWVDLAGLYERAPLWLLDLRTEDAIMSGS